MARVVASTMELRSPNPARALSIGLSKDMFAAPSARYVKGSDADRPE